MPKRKGVVHGSGHEFEYFGGRKRSRHTSEFRNQVPKVTISTVFESYVPNTKICGSTGCSLIFDLDAPWGIGMAVVVDTACFPAEVEAASTASAKAQVNPPQRATEAPATFCSSVPCAWRIILLKTLAYGRKSSPISLQGIFEASYTSLHQLERSGYLQGASKFLEKAVG